MDEKKTPEQLVARMHMVMEAKLGEIDKKLSDRMNALAQKCGRMEGEVAKCSQTVRGYTTRIASEFRKASAAVKDAEMLLQEAGKLARQSKDMIEFMRKEQEYQVPLEERIKKSLIANGKTCDRVSAAENRITQLSGTLDKLVKDVSHIANTVSLQGGMIEAHNNLVERT